MIINNSLFKVGEVPNFHPIAEMYESDEYWREQKRRCIEGYWVGGKWMPPELYYYINFHNIMFEDGVYKGLGLPWLRDIDWERAYMYTEACGFSGFEHDDEYTCHRYIRDNVPDEDIIKFCTIGGTMEVDKNYLNNFYNKQGQKKKYIEAREYLRKIHTKSLGKPLYFNEAKHIIEMASRGYGKSYSTSGLIAHNFLFDGARDYDMYLQKRKEGKPLQSETVVGAIDAKYSNKLMSKVKTALEKLPGSSTITLDGEKVFFPSPLSINYTGSFAVGREAISNRSKSVIQHVTFADNPLAAAGGRPNKVFMDECFAPGTKVRMYDLSIKNIEDIVVGDYILGIDGNPKQVGKTCNGVDTMYEIKQRFGTNYTVNSEHLLYLNQNCSTSSIKDDGIKLIKAKDFTKENLGKYRFRTTFGVKSGLINFNENIKLNIDPYWLGLWLGDGSTGTTGIAVNINKDVEIYKYIYEYANKLDLKVNEQISNHLENDLIGLCTISGIKKDNKKRCNKLRTWLQEYNIINNKRIPIDYQKASESERLELLAGIIDSDGNKNSHVNKKTSSYEISQVDRKELVDEIILLARNLGFDVSLSAKIKNIGYNKKQIKTNTKYRILIKGETWRIPCKVERKKTLKWNRTEKVNITSFKIENVGIGKYYGITLIGENPIDNLFLLEDNTIVHNCGFMGNIKEVWEGVENTQAVADFKRLTMYALGTGGLTAGGAVTYIQQLFYNPEDYGCLAFEDVWENKGKIGYFVPGTLAMNKYKEGPDMITNMVKAEKAINDEREKAKKSGNKSRIQGTIINKPLVPSEIFLRQEGTFFPVLELKQALADLESNSLLLKASLKVELIEKEKGVITLIPSDKQVITDYPVSKGTNLDAPIEIFIKPAKDINGNIPYGRYILSTDPIDDDGNNDATRSLQSTFVLDTWTDEICAEYTARTYLVDEYYENVRKLCIYYNAKNLYENNKKGLYGYFKNKNSLFYLADTPKILKDQDLAKGEGIGNRSLGVNISNDKVKFFLINLALKWFESPSYRNPEKKRLYTIRSVGLLKESISYTLDINADRMSAFLILMLYRSELEILTEQRKENNIKSVTGDPFWSHAYKNFKRNKVHSNQLKHDNYVVN